MFMQRQLARGPSYHTVYFRNNAHKILDLEKDFSLISFTVIVVLSSSVIVSSGPLVGLKA